MMRPWVVITADSSLRALAWARRASGVGSWKEEERRKDRKRTRGQLKSEADAVVTISNSLLALPVVESDCELDCKRGPCSVRGLRCARNRVCVRRSRGACGALMQCATGVDGARTRPRATVCRCSC